MTPRATVRLQLTRDFGFDAARACIDYYAALGISHFYLSPIFQARAGSTHGYDAVDFSRISDELGGADAFARLAHALREHAMGIVVDIVPNHMGVAGADNRWWRDVLAHGRRSAFADYFDIDWTPGDASLHGKVLLPYLERPYREALADGQLRLQAGAQDDWVVADAHSHWPLAPESRADAAAIAPALAGGDAPARDRLHALLERQHYRLDSWRAAADRINWRRFFDVAELAALRIEDERVFGDVHKEIFALFSNGLIDGVRVDHVDGLAFPFDYCRHLRDEFEARRAARPHGLHGAPAYIVVEKIFAAHEPQRDWGVAGTTGYDFMDQCGAVLHNPAGQGALDMLWRRVSGRPWEYRAAIAEARRQVLAEAFGADLERVARAFHALATHAPMTAHLRFAAIKHALAELIVAFPVYRCYGLPGALPPEDAAILARALERANRELNPGDYEALDFVVRCLRDAPEAEVADQQRKAAVRFQQLTAPIAAKAIEDTVFYREARLLSRNEVGSDPDCFSLALDDFHADCATRARRFPNGMLTTATHDHKRGEDVRARLAVLSDAADLWTETVSRWIAVNAAHKRMAGDAPAPDAIDEFMLYQTLVGAWPLADVGTVVLAHFRERVERWWIKALREAKRHSSWIAPNARYEEGCREFLGSILDAQAANRFRAELAAFVDTIAAAAAINGLVQTFLRLTTPGVPDLYQGCELWNFSLVDPDNRTPVDYAGRQAPDIASTPGDLLTQWRNGRVKQALIARLLRHRAQWPRFYRDADYTPLRVAGDRSAHAIAFERRSEDGRLLCVAMRWPLSLAGSALAQPLIAADRWDDCALALPDGVAYRDVLSDEHAPIRSGELRIADALRRFPVAVYFAPSVADSA